MQIIVYSTNTCPHCKDLKDYLSSKNISFVEKLIDEDEAAKEEMGKESNGFMGVPFSVIIKDDGTKDFILGFDKGKFDLLLG